METKRENRRLPLQERFDTYVNRVYAEHDILVLSPIEDFKDVYSILIHMCMKNGHFIWIAPIDFWNRIRAKLWGCSDCFQEHKYFNIESLSDRLEENINKNGGKFISYDKETRMVEYICPCEQYKNVTASNVIRGGKICLSCSVCSNILSGNKWTYEEVCRLFVEQDCELLENIYVNNKTHMKYICICRNEAVTTLHDFLQGKRCWDVCKMDKQQQSAYRRKEYKFPNDRIERVQGYEPQCLDELIKIYDEDDIIVRSKYVPKIKYMRLNDEGKEVKATYHPDIYIKSHSKLIEVKSTFTYEKDIENNLRKFSTAYKSGYDFEVRIYKVGRKKQVILDEEMTKKATKLYQSM